jgi:hypothetical protein
MRSGLKAMFLATVAVAAACSPTGGNGKGLKPEDHTFFPITAGAHALDTQLVDGVMTCESCHPADAPSFKDIACTGCHGHAQGVTDRLHTSVADYAYSSDRCLACHPAGEKVPYDHAGITGECAQCHDVGTQFAALPKAGFTHPATGGSDCGGCHFSFTEWTGGQGGPVGLVSDPSRDLTVNALAPTFSGTTISAVSALTQVLPMKMSHAPTGVAAGAFSACDNCHPNASLGSFFPGSLHSTLNALMLPEPSACGSCHTPSRPEAFVGPLDLARAPSTGPMRHDAVAWANNAPTNLPLVTQDCAVCHLAPTDNNASSWAIGRPQGDGGFEPMRFHANLTAAALMQPGSCLDCHANSRPTAVLTNANAALPANISFDHQALKALDDCASCHVRAAAPQYATWAQGRFHLAGDANPATCLPCHAGQRPTSTAGWQSTTYTQRPFDYGTNARGVTHGAGLDCATCHPGPGSGAWGSTQNWVGGNFVHGAGTLSATTCVSCHMSQRADLLPAPNNNPALINGFDHSLNGTGDCFGCHQATVVANSYVNLYNPGTGNLPNGDWKGGVTYPGSVFVASLTQSLTLQQTRLNRGGPNNLVTSTTATNATYYNGMSHTSAVLPAALNAGPPGAPDNTKCWHCHTNDAGTVTNFSNGVYHSALTNYRATVGGALAPFPQPTTGCNDCHAQMRPTDVVLRAANDLLPMDHNAAFTATVNIGGTNTNNANGLDCSRCHQTAAGTTWADGVYHARIATAVPQDCVTCHYPLMANAARSDLTSGTQYAMRHRSGQLTTQACATCHTTALAQSTTAPATAARWQTGRLHPSLTTQPAACLDCHAVSDPTGATQGSVVYALAQGGTASNGAQWMRHTAASVVGKDCAFCHAADAKQLNSAWNKATVLHKAGVVTSTCRECHGLTNGGGTLPGTNNNMPAGVTDSKTLSPVSSIPNSGVPAGTYARITHADLNATGKDCNFCHTQVGASTSPGIAGNEWEQASFHVKFTSANPLTVNGTTARCSNCHLAEKPGAAYTAYNHTALTGASGSTDCASCHAWPGTGTTTNPNWKGAVGGAPVYISVGGFNITQPPAPNGTTIQGGIANLPHPPGTCAQCHTGGTGGKNAFGYDHAQAPNTNCRACHESGSNLVGTVWNPNAPGAANTSASCSEGGGTIKDRGGDTRAIDVTTIACGDKASTKLCGTRTCSLNHFYPADCSECHNKPAAGIRTTSSGATYVQAWRFPHSRNAMAGATTCCMCHTGAGRGCP